MSGPVWVGPDCDTGKCRACDGRAWNYDDDEPTSCMCLCHERVNLT